MMVHTFYDKMHSCANKHYRTTTVDEVSADITCRNKNKSAGLNGIYMESLIFAGDKLNVCCLLSVRTLLFTLCVYGLCYTTTGEK